MTHASAGLPSTAPGRRDPGLGVLTATVFLPLVFGYYLSYLFRTINAAISGRLVTDLSLDASQLGLLTAGFFLTSALGQLPLGIALDRFGPGRHRR